ncbi:unnamed protein product [Dicrocoelium dendriticum]|nr:unnamed protein product [Dicrocoelium dendriticum]
MSISAVLQAWNTSCDVDDFSCFLDAVKAYVSAGNRKDEISGTSNVKTLNSILCAAFSDNYPQPVQRCILDLIQHFGSNTSMRYRLITSFSILKSLAFGLISTSPVGTDQARLLELVQLYTIDLHHLCVSLEPELFSSLLKFVIRVIRQSKSDESLEPALCILASLSRFSSLIQQCLAKKDDFEVLRKTLLHIMTSDSVSQSCLVCCMAVRFYLWKAADKFFEGVHAHKTIQILFNLLLNGEISLSGICAGELLADLCSEPQVMAQLSSFPGLKSCLREAVVQLRAKDSELVLKLLHLLRCLLMNKTDHDVVHLLRTMFFESWGTSGASKGKEDVSGDDSLRPLNTLFALASASDDLVASAALDFILRLIDTGKGGEIFQKKNTPTSSTILEWLLDLALTGLRKICGAGCASFRQLQDATNNDHSLLSSKLLRLTLFIRLLDSVLMCIQENQRGDSVLSGSEQNILDHCCCMMELLFKMILGHFEGNPLIVALTSGAQSKVDSPEPRSYKADLDSCLLSADVAIEAMGLAYTCVEVLTAFAPGASQDDDEVSLTQPRVSGAGEATPRPSQESVRKCGQSLQELLECPETPGLLALGLLTSSDADAAALDPHALGMGQATRTAVVRLLSAALHLDGFDNTKFASQLTRLQAANKNRNHLLDSFYSDSTEDSRLSFSFLSQWLRLSAGGGLHCVQSSRCTPAGAFDSPQRTSLVQGEFGRLERKVDKFLSEREAQMDKERTADPSDVISVFEFKIKLLQNREDALEASASANAEALSQSNRLCQHYRERAIVAEAESKQLRILQLDAVARMEVDGRSLKSLRDNLKKHVNEINELREKLSHKQQECQDLVLSTENLQKKLNAAREQNRAMDATIDDYRSQLDQAKEQIQAQSAQITKFTQITRLINDLTGNPSADVSTVQAQMSGSREGGSCLTDCVTGVSPEEKKTRASVVSGKKPPARSTRR